MTTPRPLARLAWGLGALAALACLVLGVPLALTLVVGWPLPHGIPSVEEIGSALSGQTIDQAVLIKTLAVLCWLAWGEFVACVGAEIAGWRRGRGARHVPLAGSLQPLVAQLLMTAALLVHLFPRPTSASPPMRVTTTPAVHVVETSTPTQMAAAPLAAPADTAITYVVKPRDDLWRLAERHLGAGHRWRELFTLNEGRPQPNGDALRRPNLIRPGWVLAFPADAVGLTADEPAPGPDPAGITPVPVEPATFETGAEVATEACSQIITPNVVSALPQPTAPPSAPPSPDPEHSTPQSQSHDPSSETASPAGTPQEGAPGVMVGIVAASLVATGLVATIDRLRRAQQRRRPRGRQVRMPAAEVVPTEIAARRAAAGSAANRLDLALRAFSRCAANRRGRLPRVSTVQVGDAGIEILLAAALDAPAEPFTISAGGQVWTLPPDVAQEALVQAAGDVGAPIPALASIGALGSSAVLIDLEAVGTTALTGDPDTVRHAFRSLVLELATSAWADTLDVVVVADDPDALGTIDRVRVVASIDQILAEAEAAAAGLSDALVATSASTTLEARSGPTAADGWIPTIVLCANPAADTDAISHLVALAGTGGRGLAVVTAGEMPGAERVVCYGGENVNVSPPGVKLSMTGFTRQQREHLEEILIVAADHDGVATADPGGPAGHDSTVLDVAFGEKDFDVLVRLLGPVEIEGAAEPLDRRRAVELVVYLATHPKGLDDERLKTALWPDERAPQSSFNTTVTRARSRLGKAEDGTLHLPHVVGTGGIYCVGPRVTTDFAVLERHLAAARKAAPDVAIRLLRTALELARGLPFAGMRQGYEWAYAEGLVARMETVVAEAAHHLATLALEARNAELAQWSACQGLRGCPGDEVLYRDRMLACDQAGNPAAVEAVMDELVAAAEAVEPYDTLHPETLALYERLSHRRRRTG